MIAAAAPTGARTATRRRTNAAASEPVLSVVPKPEAKTPRPLKDHEQSFVLERDEPVMFHGTVFELKLGGVTAGFLTLNGHDFPLIHVTAEARVAKKPQTWLMKVHGFATFRLTEVDDCKVQFDVVRVLTARIDTPLAARPPETLGSKAKVDPPSGS